MGVLTACSRCFVLYDFFCVLCGICCFKVRIVRFLLFCLFG